MIHSDELQECTRKIFAFIKKKQTTKTDTYTHRHKHTQTHTHTHTDTHTETHTHTLTVDGAVSVLVWEEDGEQAVLQVCDEVGHVVQGLAPDVPLPPHTQRPLLGPRLDGVQAFQQELVHCGNTTIIQHPLAPHTIMHPSSHYRHPLAPQVGRGQETQEV